MKKAITKEGEMVEKYLYVCVRVGGILKDQENQECVKKGSKKVRIDINHILPR